MRYFKRKLFNKLNTTLGKTKFGASERVSPAMKDRIDSRARRNQCQGRLLPLFLSAHNETSSADVLLSLEHRYRSLNKRETDRHRLIMCHCHFLYDCIYYRSIHVNRSFKQRKRSFKRRKSSSISSYNYLSIDDNFCPYTRQITFNAHDENDLASRKKLDITCPMEQTCADVRILDEIASRIKLKKTSRSDFTR